MAQQLTTLNKKMEKLEVAATGTQVETLITCGLCGVLMKITTAALLEKISQWSKPTIWEISKDSPTMILMPILIIRDGRTTLTLVGKEPKSKEPPFQPRFPQQQPNIPPAPQPKPPQTTSFEATLENLTLTTAGFVQTTNNFIEEARANFRNQESAIRNLETQVGQIAKQLPTKFPNAFPSDTEVNPKGEYKASTDA
ncbi:hypothetical protein PIB30_086757 [Stylosanthes scabra]|uniref:Uncharacterized protein n=1 Tax=Stylosanthes scabra TaxID=79078 RepID=A0ABU6US29_9FABA|nr:hypothetical protein [Stylosanthes scabra]